MRLAAFLPLLAIPAPSLAQVPVPADIEAWLPSNATDFVDPQAVVTSVGAVACTFGQVGRAVEFTSPGEVQATYADPVQITSGGDLTIEGWAFWNPLGNPVAGNWIAGDGYGNSGVTLMSASGGNGFHLHYGGADPGQTAKAGLALPGNRWVHFAARKSGSLVEFFFDGQLVGWDLLTSSGNMPRFLENGVHLGHDGVGWFAGKLDDVSLYSRALSDAEITGIYLAGAAGKRAPFPTVRIDLPAGGTNLFGLRSYPSGFQYAFDGSRSRRETSHVWSLKRLSFQLGVGIRWVPVAQHIDCTAAGLWSLSTLPSGLYRLQLGVQNPSLGVITTRHFYAQ